MDTALDEKKESRPSRTCSRPGGSSVTPGYLLRIVTTDLAAYQRLQDEKLSVLPGVQRMTSTLVMKKVVNDRPLPA